MSSITKIGIKGFRRLSDIELDFKKRPFIVMIGANGVGKTSVLDALMLLSASAEGRLNKTLSEFGGITQTLTYGKAKKLFFFVEEDIQGKQPLEYKLVVSKSAGGSYNIEMETLTQSQHGKGAKPFKHIDSTFHNIDYYDMENKKFVSPTWQFNYQETTLSQVPKMFKESEELRQTLSSFTLYHVLNISGQAPIRLPQKMQPADLPGKDGEDLIPFLYNLRETNPTGYEAFEDAIRAGFPRFEKISFPSPASGMLTMTWKEKDFDTPFFMHQLSEGTLRFLWLAALLQSEHLSEITMIDEPEVSLHPELLRLLVDLMREAAERTQIIVATHSDRLLRFLKPKEILIMDIGDDGTASAVSGDTLDLDKWLDEYTLDEIWRMGRMGGRE